MAHCVFYTLMLLRTSVHVFTFVLISKCTMEAFKVYELRYVAYLATSGSNQETTN